MENFKLLTEIFNSGAEKTHIVFAGYVAVQVLCPSLGMAHLAEHASVRRRDALYCADRAVRVVLNVIRRVSGEVNILGRDLSVIRKLLDKSIGTDKAAFAVRDRNGIYVSDVCVHEPRGLVGRNARSDELGLVSAYYVEGQRRAVFIGVYYLTERNKSELYKSLETVADAAHKSVAVAEQVIYAVLYNTVSEERSDEFCGTVRFIAAGEAAGQE